MLGRRTFNIDAPWYFRRFLRQLVQQATRQVVRSRQVTEYDEDPLFVSDTRPAMAFGVPHVMTASLLIAFGESIVFLGPIWAFWVLIPWSAAMAAVRKDYNMPRVWFLWLQTKALAFESFTWGGSSPDPFPRRSKYPRGIWRD